MPGLSGAAIKRLVKEWERLRDAPGDGPDCVTGGPLTEENMGVWSIKCNNLDHEDASTECKAVAKQLKDKGHDPAIEFRLHFPEHYPADPPFVYVHAPCITGGHIHGAGAICLDVLHQAGWTPATRVDSLLRTIRSNIDNMTLETNWLNADGTLRCNSVEEAKQKATWISNVHRDWQERRAERPKPPPQAPAKRARR